MTAKQIRIVNNWEMFEAAEPDISTERLMQMTADASKCDVADVSDALHQRQQEEKEWRRARRRREAKK